MQQELFKADTLDKNARRKAEKILFSYKMIDAQLKSMELDIPSSSLVASYSFSESQRTLDSHPNSTSEGHLLKIEKFSELKLKKDKLDILFNSLPSVLQQIWRYRYMEQLFDVDVQEQVGLGYRSYHKKKTQLICIIAEAFYLL